jgi:TRAP transporter TAXI family solute receptor
MSTVSHVKQGLLFCQVVSLALLLASCSKEEVPSFSIGTGGVEGSYRAAGLALARSVNEDRAINGFQLGIEISSGSVSNIDSIAAGHTQFGIAQADDQYQAVKGLGEWKDKGPQEDLRAVFSMYTESVTLVAGEDSGIRSIDDLRGKIVDIGSSGSGTRQNAIDALRAAGIDWQNDIRAREESLDDRLAKFMHGELDAFFSTVGHPNKEIKFATFSVRGARIIPLENIDILVSENPYFSRVLIPSGLYPKAYNEVDIETIGVNATLLTSAKVSEDVVYAVTKAVFENLESLTDFNAEFNALMGDKFLKGLTAPIHPGALKYYREVGIHVPSR